MKLFSQKEGCISSQSDWQLLKNSVPSNLLTVCLIELRNLSLTQPSSL